MRNVVVTVVGFAISLSASMTHAGSIVIAGSSLISPPPFWEDSFWGMPPSIDRAFPFQVIEGVAYDVQTLEVAAYHYPALAGNIAYFSVHADTGGLPGAPLINFVVDGISETQQVVAAASAAPGTLLASTTYWLVCQTPAGQVNWNLGDNAFGVAAYRVNDGGWTILPHSNVSAFALLGTPVPEPSTALLLIVFVLGSTAPTGIFRLTRGQTMRVT